MDRGGGAVSPGHAALVAGRRRRGRADGERHRCRSGGATGACSHVGETVRAVIAGRRSVGDDITAHAARAMRWDNADRDTPMRPGIRPRKIYGRSHPIADRDTVLVAGTWRGGSTKGAEPSDRHGRLTWTI